jgi:hypothetical protein
MNFPQDLQVGNILLYSTKDIVDSLIEWKTGSDVAHIEIYMGGGISWASRNGIGVNTYPFRSSGLVKVRKLIGNFNLPLAQIWFEKTQKGQPYGFGDILANENIITKFPGEDCSHFVAACCEVGECPQFDPIFPKARISPRDFEITLESITVYTV